jgi:transcriptional regulator with PAS, ATPase and Fis domain
MKAALDRAARAAFTHTTVLLRGASGVGKELVAQSIHNASSRAEQPFIPVNCAAIPSELFESELFGHERGAFTGAASCKAGWFELADGGTLFLDEIGDLPMSLQGKLLRVLQDGTFYRVGGTKPMKSDVRILAATNQNLEAKIRDGAFREDLYYRLNVITISLPALCERPEDIPILVEYFLKKYSMGTGRAKSGATPRAMQILMNYQWPGNVRELENTIEHAVVLGNSEIVDVDDLPSHLIDNDASSAFKSSLSLEDAQRQFKKRYISRVLRQTGGNRTQAAKILQIERTYLSRLISNLDIAVS